MSLNFKYIDYDKKFYGEYLATKKTSNDELFVFYDNRMRDKFIKRMGQNIFNPIPQLVTWEEFVEKIFFTDKIVLKEVKRVLTFFKSLNKELKNELRIDTYFDAIDIANSFFKHYRELYLGMIDEVTETTNIQKWQKRQIENFSKIKILFDEMCEKYNYIPNDWLEKKENYNDRWIKRFSKIYFVDIVEFPKLYVDIIKKISESQNVEFLLQMNRDEFDEKNLKLKHIEVPEKKQDIKIYNTQDELEDVGTLLFLAQDKKINLYSPKLQKGDFSKIVPQFFAPNTNATMDNTRLYKFLNRLLDLLLSMEERLGRTYKISKLLSSFEDGVFRDYYGISSQDFVSLNSCAKDGYKYISRKILEESWFEKNFSQGLLEKFQEIFFDLEKIEEIKNTKELYDFFKTHIALEKFMEEELDNLDFIDKFFEIFGIIKSNEDMKIHRDFNEYFGKKIGVSLFRLLVQYMKDIGIKSNVEFDNEVVLIKDMDFLKYNENKSDINCFLDVTDEFVPRKWSTTSIFTEKQRKVMGLVDRDEKRETERYRFFQAIFSGKDSVIFTKKDVENNVDISPFLEEIILKYKLEILPPPIKKDEVLSVLSKRKNIFTTPGEVDDGKNMFSKEEGDYKEKKLYLGFYDYKNLTSCQLKFYFESLNKLEHIIKFEDKDINLRVLGIIVHDTLEKLVYKRWEEIVTNGVSEIDYEEIEMFLNSAFKENRAKIPVHMDSYIEKVMIPKLSKNIENFFKDLKLKYMNIPIKRFQGEKSSYEKTPFYSGDMDIYLKGRADLVIESDGGDEIIDYKTGNKSDGQLDFYKIILYGEDREVKKSIFNVWNGKSIEEDNIYLTKEDLLEFLREYEEIPLHLPAEKKSVCTSCEYINICGRGKR